MTTTFTPPTYSRATKRIYPEESVMDMSTNLFWSNYGAPYSVGYTVIIAGGAATTYPGKIGATADEWAAADSGTGEGGKSIFRGGITYTINSTESTILEAAGYTLIGPGFSSGFSSGFDVAS